MDEQVQGTIDRVRREIVRDTAILGAPIAVSIAIYYALWAPLPPHSHRPIEVMSNIGLYVIFAVLIAVVGHWRLRSLFRRRLDWLARDRVPTADDETMLRSIPARLARELLVGMLGVAAISAGLNARGGGLNYAWVRTTVGLVLLGFTFATTTYLTTERVLRPIFALGLTTDHMSGVGVRARLLLVWLLGSGVPLLFIAAIPLRGRGGAQLSASVLTTFLVIVGLISGGLTTSVVAGSIADPLQALRSALARAGGGDLDAELAVDDPGELGLVQRAFNRMLAGLRERRKLEDLFGRHVGTEIARRAIDTEIELGGEVRDVTVLFVDIIGSTAFTESRDPVEVVDVLNRFFEVVVDVTRTDGGWVNKFEGDAALCVFGAPSDETDHRARGLRAARQLARALESFPLRTGIGVSSGEVVAGNVGAEHRYEYTVIGKPVNEAARLADAAKQAEHGVLVAMSAVDGAPVEAEHWSACGEMTLRGVAQPVAVAEPA